MGIATSVQTVRVWSIQHWRTAAILFSCYALADVLLNMIAFSDGWTILWPINGISVAILISQPRRAWPWILIGIETGLGVGEYFDGNSFVSELVLRSISALELVLCACLLPPFTKLTAWLRTPGFFKSLLMSLALGPSVSGLLAAIYTSKTTGQAFFSAYNDWATADALGIVVTLPFALACTSEQMQIWLTPQRLPHFLTAILTALTVCAVSLATDSYPLLFLVYPALLFIDLLLGIAGSATAILGVAVIAVFCAEHHLGPFGAWSSALLLKRDHALQLYIGFHALLLLPASILRMEHRRLAAELHTSNEQLSRLANLDPLTGLANRRAFDEHLGRHWSQAIENTGPIALALIDLDNFKAYNDVYGHASGDRCLRATAQAIQTAVAHPGDIAARIGGEEFALLLPGTDCDGARLVAERAREAVVGLSITHRENPPRTVTISIGYIAVTPGKSDSPIQMIQLADAALYQAKAAGRNRALTIASSDGLTRAKEHFGDTTRTRLLKLVGLREPLE